MPDGGNTDRDWQAVIGRALAFLCLTQADLRDKGLAEQTLFLEGLGLTRKEAAAMLGSTADSLTELIRQSKLKKGGARGAAKKQAKK
jgi:hypothetical protein